MELSYQGRTARLLHGPEPCYSRTWFFYAFRRRASGGLHDHWSWLQHAKEFAKVTSDLPRAWLDRDTMECVLETGTYIERFSCSVLASRIRFYRSLLHRRGGRYGAYYAGTLRVLEDLHRSIASGEGVKC